MKHRPKDLSVLIPLSNSIAVVKLEKVFLGDIQTIVLLCTGHSVLWCSVTGGTEISICILMDSDNGNSVWNWRTLMKIQLAVYIRFAVIFLGCEIKLKNIWKCFPKLIDYLANKVRKRRSPAIAQTHDSLLASFVPGVTRIREFRMLVRVLHKLLHI